jgi:ABC-type polysaccharide/polyol phosphate transport system ATPase subunit
MDSLLTAKQLLVTYPHFSLEISSFEMKDKDRIAIIGHNGSGKST